MRKDHVQCGTWHRILLSTTRKLVIKHLFWGILEKGFNKMEKIYSRYPFSHSPNTFI